jgi:cytochrome c-type biogenesis protein CcmE
MIKVPTFSCVALIIGVISMTISMMVMLTLSQKVSLYLLPSELK